MTAFSEFKHYTRKRGYFGKISIISVFHLSVDAHKKAYIHTYSTSPVMACIDLHQQAHKEKSWLGNSCFSTIQNSQFWLFLFYLSFLWRISDAFIYFVQRKSPTYGTISEINSIIYSEPEKLRLATTDILTLI